jgi:hypothetical protein
MNRTHDPHVRPAVDPSALVVDIPQNNPMQILYEGFVKLLFLRDETFKKLNGLFMVYRFKMLLERFVADCQSPVQHQFGLPQG